MPNAIDVSTRIKVVKLNRAGVLNKEIAQKLGIYVDTVSAILLEAGLYSPASKRKVIIPKEEVLSFHAEGLTNGEIAERVGVDRKYIGRFLNRNGLSANQKHPGISMIDEENAKCTKCGSIVPRADLPWGRVTTHPYQLSYCRSCLTNSSVSNTKKSPQQYLKHRQRALKTRSREQSIAFDMPPDYLNDLYVQQKGLCFYTDEPMKIYFGTNRSGSRRDSLSVDKIIPRRGYTQGNIVLCINRANSVKHDCTLDEIKEWMPGWYARIEALLHP